MLALRLPPAIEKRLERLAKKTGRTKSYYAREAILRHVEDLEDANLAGKRSRRTKGRVPLDVIERQQVNGDPVIPRAVRKRLALQPGDTLRYRIAEEGVLIEKANEADDPFTAFSEWTEEADEKAYGSL